MTNTEQKIKEQWRQEVNGMGWVERTEFKQKEEKQQGIEEGCLGH